MANSKNLMASQQFMTRELLSYEDELFGLLYHDIGDFAAQRSPRIVSQDRRISIYGVRGVGKTTAMQGVLWHVLSTSKDTKVMPITITVKGAKAASSIKELEDAFYRSVISGVLEVAEFYYTLKQRVFRIVKALFVAQSTYCYTNFYPFFHQKGFDRSPACRQHTLL